MQTALLHEIDPAQKIWAELGKSLEGITLFHNKLILATYQRPEKTAGGFIQSAKSLAEDKYQSKIGLLIKAGDGAFKDPAGKWFSGLTFELGDWLLFRPAEGWAMGINNVQCRMFDDVNIVGRVAHPDLVY